MVSFASPLFWQIHYLVTNLSKKNFKSNVAELNQLVGLYGEDARIFLLNCLVKDIDFRDARSQNKDALKIQLLAHEIAQASSKPNFTTILCEAIDASNSTDNSYKRSSQSSQPRFITEDFLTNFCRALKLTVPQQVTIGLSFAQGENADSAREAVEFLKIKIPEISTCGSKLPSDVLHALVFVLRMKDEFRSEMAETDSLLASISAAHPNDMNSMEIAPLTLGDPDHVDCVPIADPDLFAKLVADVNANCLFYELLEDVGYAATSSARAFRTLLAEAGLDHAPTIPPAQVAGMLAMLARTFNALSPDTSATLMAHLPFACDAGNGLDELGDASYASTTPASNPFDSSKDNWDFDVIAEVLQKDYPSIKWTKVAEKLDREDLFIANAAQLRVLISAFQQFSQTKFKIATLLRTFKHSRAHLSLLKAAIESPPEVLSFAESPRKLAPFEGADASQAPKNGVWFSLDAVETLLALSEQDCYEDVRRLFDGAMKSCPDVLIANLAQAAPRWNGLRDDVFADLFAAYILGRPNAPAIMRHLWSVAPKLVLYASVKCFYAATSPQIISRLFALFRNTGDAFASAIHSNYFSFAISLAVMGANHDVLALEPWLVERLASQRTAFATSCLAFVHRNYARAIPKSTVTPQTSHVLSIESLAVVLKCILAVQTALPPTISLELKRVIALCMEAHPVISSAARTQVVENNVVSATPIAAVSTGAGSGASGAATTVPGVVVGGVSVAAGSALVSSAALERGGLLGSGGSASGGDAPPAFTAEMIEEQANAYFQQIYTSEQNINDVVAMLKRFQGSRDERERQIFYCMIHNLFDEYRFFPRYPEMELRITGVLFGKLIEHHVLPPNFLQTALRSVLESLREPVNSKFFFFGAVALQQFVPRLKELPAYCTNLSQIAHLQHALPEIMRHVNQITRTVALNGGLKPSSGGTATATGSGEVAGSASAPPGGSLLGAETAVASKFGGLSLGSSSGASGASGVTSASPAKPETPRKPENDSVANASATASTGDRAPGAGLGIQIPPPLGSSNAPAPRMSPSAASASSPKVVTPQKMQQLQQQQQALSPPAVLIVDHIFHETSHVDDHETVEQPDETVKDRIHFIVNNMSISNLDAKIPEVRKLLVDAYHAWMAQYLVVKRISTQPNYHAVFLVFIEKLNRPELEREILKRTLQNARKLLTSGTITTNSQQRSLLKNLGSWLGVFTLARNKPLLQRDVDLKELLYVGYETGHLIAVTPFVAKILEGCKKSKIFKPPNPWLMGMIHAMSEIYDVPDLKLNLKFEIEVLFKQFKLNVEDQRKAQLLHTRATPPRVSNPDFNVKSAPKHASSSMGIAGTGMMLRSATPPPGGAKLSSLGMGQKPLLPSGGATTPSKASLLRPGLGLALGKLPGEYTPSSSPPPGGRDSLTGGYAAGAAGGAGATVNNNTVSESTVIPNLASYVAVNPDLPLHNVNLRRLVPLAVDRAIREVISPVVERSVTIACITSREIILKDFATEVDDVKMRKAAHLMVASMAGSLALITAKEPLRNSIATHLRALIPASAGEPLHIENVVQVCSNENTDLGCMLIEKASSEKAMRDIDEALGAAYASRRRFQQQQLQSGKPLAAASSVNYFEGAAHQPPSALPEVFKPKPGGVPHPQLVVYEAFQRLPRAASMPTAASAAPSTSAAAMAAGVRTPGSGYGGGVGGPMGPMSAEKDRSGSSSGASALSALAGLAPSDMASLSGVGLGPGGGVTVAAALDRFAGLMEKFELFVQNVVRQATAAQRDLPSLLAIPGESEVFAVLREVRALGAAVKPTLREEACLKIGHRIVKCMYELGGGRGDELFLEILVSSLEALAQSCDKLKKEVAGWILRAPVEDKLKLHCEVMIALVRFRAVELSEFDVYLTRNMERNSVAIEFAVHIVRQCLPMDHVTLAKQLPNTLDALSRIVERHGASANKNVQILAALLDQARTQRARVGSGAGAGVGVKPVGSIGSGGKPPSAAASAGSLVQEHAAFRHTVSNALEHWIAIYKEPSSNSKIHAQYIQMLKQYGLLTDDESISLFFRFGTELCVDACLKSAAAATNGSTAKQPLNYGVVDALTHLMVLLVKYLDPQANTKLQVLNHAVGAIANVLVAAHDLARKKNKASAATAPGAFDQRVFFRMFANLMKDLTVQEPVLDAIHLQVLNTFASAYNTLQPLMLPGFAFAWTELVAHRCFMPLLLRAKQQRGWQILHRLLMNLFVFLEPFLRHANTHQLSPAIAELYKGTVRIVLVLLHDYPEFLSDFYSSFCDVLPTSCVQLRNVILSAFSRSMRLPDPLTLGLQVAQLPEVSVSPRLMPAWGTALQVNGIKEYVDEFLRATSNRAAVFPHDLIAKLLRPQSHVERDPTACKYSIPALNALVLYLGKEAIVEMANGAAAASSLSSSSSSASAGASGASGSAADAKHGATVKFEQTASMDVFRFLADELDAEGRYWYFSSLANHLRYPNAHTHYFSCVILYLFSSSNNKMVKEQITRVLIERLIANRPHPWGLLVTFIELIRNKSYKFWEQEYLDCSSEIKEVFDDVARTCLGNSAGHAMTPLASN